MKTRTTLATIALCLLTGCSAGPARSGEEPPADEPETEQAGDTGAPAPDAAQPLPDSSPSPAHDSVPPDSPYSLPADTGAAKDAASGAPDTGSPDAKPDAKPDADAGATEETWFPTSADLASPASALPACPDDNCYLLDGDGTHTTGVRFKGEAWQFAGFSADVPVDTESLACAADLRVTLVGSAAGAGGGVGARTVVVRPGDTVVHVEADAADAHPDAGPGDIFYPSVPLQIRMSVSSAGCKPVLYVRPAYFYVRKH